MKNTVLTLVLSAMVLSRHTRSSRFSTTSVWKVCQFLVTTNCLPANRSRTVSTHRRARFVSRCGSDTYGINLDNKIYLLHLLMCVDGFGVMFVEETLEFHHFRKLLITKVWSWGVFLFQALSVSNWVILVWKKILCRMHIHIYIYIDYIILFSI